MRTIPVGLLIHEIEYKLSKNVSFSDPENDQTLFEQTKTQYAKGHQFSNEHVEKINQVFKDML